MHMFPSTIKKSVMSMQLAYLNDGSIPVKKVYSNGICITTECPGLYKNA